MTPRPTPLRRDRSRGDATASRLLLTSLILSLPLWCALRGRVTQPELTGTQAGGEPSPATGEVADSPTRPGVSPLSFSRSRSACHIV
jgi:hypothetical protein